MTEDARCLLQYNSLLERGELKDMFPNLSGDWVKDKKKFTKYFEDARAILEMEVIIEDEEDESWREDAYEDFSTD